jgi:hypothetical protein
MCAFLDISHSKCGKMNNPKGNRGTHLFMYKGTTGRSTAVLQSDQWKQESEVV